MTQNVICDAGETGTAKQGRGCEVHSQGLRRVVLMDGVRHETCKSFTGNKVGCAHPGREMRCQGPKDSHSLNC